MPRDSQSSAGIKLYGIGNRPRLPCFFALCGFYFLRYLIVRLAVGASWIKFAFKLTRRWKEIRIHTFSNLRIVQEYAHTTSS